LSCFEASKPFKSFLGERRTWYCLHLIVPVSLLDTIGKLFEKMLLTRIQTEVSGRGLLKHGQFRLKPQNGTALQLVRSFEKVTRNFGEKRLTGAVFVDVA